MSTPVFIDLTEGAQAAELRSFLKSSKGADIGEESTGNLVQDLTEIVKHCSVTFTGGTSPADAEAVMNSVVCLLFVLPGEESADLVESFCSQLEAPPSPVYLPTCPRVLSNLFCGLPEKSPLKYTVYRSMVRLAATSNSISDIPTDLKQVRTWCLSDWQVGQTQYQELLRSLHDALVNCKCIKQASSVMVELLGTYSEDTASQAQEDASRCIVTALGDPDTFLMDNLLRLKPVQLLKGEQIHTLLNIFVEGRLSEYLAFHAANKSYMEEIGLSHSQCLEKMRVLNFLLLAERQKVLPFDMIEKEVQVKQEDIEQFIIDVIATEMVYARVNESSQTVNIGVTAQRTFDSSQWEELRSDILQWEMQIGKVKNSLQEVITDVPAAI